MGLFRRKKKEEEQQTVPLSTLQHVNEEMYAHNAALVRKNKVLSLMGDLYTAGAGSLESAKLAADGVHIFQQALDVPFVGIIKVADEHTFFPYAYMLGGEKEPYTFSSSSQEDYKYTGTLSLGAPIVDKKSIEDIFRLRENAVDAKIGHIRHFSLTRTDGRAATLLVVGFPLGREEMNELETEAIQTGVQSLGLSFEKTNAYEELQLANEKLRELDELKTEFISIASHQLRTPLSIIKGYVSLMQDGAYGKMPKESLEILHNIDISNERLVKLVDDFLDVSRLEQGRTKYTFGTVEIRALIEGMVTELSEKAKEKQITIDAVYDEKLPATIIGDEERIRHSAFNFLDNAIKYSPASSTIHVSVGLDAAGQIVYTVRDEGVGLDADDLRNLFQKFYRSPKVIRDFQGTGLGLFVVKRFIEAHGGQVWAKSPGVGKGSEFGFFIPTTPTGDIYNTWVAEQTAKGLGQ